MNKIKFENLKTKVIGQKNFYYEQIDSTQKEIWRRVEKEKIDNGTLIVADIQTAGFGTHGRKWYTEKTNNIAFSLILFPNCHIDKLNNLTFEIAEIWTNIFKDLYEIELDIKLPNDLMIKGKKVGGILTETKLQGNDVRVLVIGIGINTNQKELSYEIKDISTSIRNEFNIEINNYKVIGEFCNRLETKLDSILL